MVNGLSLARAARAAALTAAAPLRFTRSVASVSIPRMVLRPQTLSPALSVASASSSWVVRAAPCVVGMTPAGIRNASTTAAGAQTTADAAGSAVLHANDDDFREKVLKAPGLVLVDFYADWCPPCRMMSPHLEQIAKDGSVTVVKVNSDDAFDTATDYKVSALPTVVAFRDGKSLNRFVGYRDLKAIKDFIGQLKA